jgi:hypothetical protein
MNINLYIKAHVFKSSDAAVKLANNDKDIRFAFRLITNKISKTVNSSKKINFKNLAKYHQHVTKLNNSHRNSGFICLYTPKVTAAINDMLKQQGSTNQLVKSHSMPAPEQNVSVTVNEHMDYINSPENIKDLKNKVFKACDNVLIDDNVNTTEFRRITTGLVFLSKLNDPVISTKAMDFLKTTVTNDKDTIRSYGDLTHYSNETLLKVKEHVEQINKIVSNTQT